MKQRMDSSAVEKSGSPKAFRPLIRALAASVLVFAAFAPATALADTAFLGSTSRSVIPGAVDSGAQGTTTLSAMGFWLSPQNTGTTTLELRLPRYTAIDGVPAHDRTFTFLNARARANYAPVNLSAQGLSFPVVTESDEACGVYAFAIDPTNGDLYAVLGRTPNVSNCLRTSTRWLTRYNPETGRFHWIASMRMRGLEFLPDGTLLGIAGNGGPSGRGAIHEINKNTGTLTYRARPTDGSQYGDLVYNRGDGMLYIVERCYVNRIDPSNWTWTSSYHAELCSLRRTSASLASPNVIHFRYGDWSNSDIYSATVDPDSGSMTSFDVAQRTSYVHRMPMLGRAGTTAGADKSCAQVGSQTVRCGFASIGQNEGVGLSVPVSYNIPSNATPGVYTGSLTWRRDGKVIKTSPLNLRVIAPDVAVSLSPRQGRYQVAEGFAWEATLSAPGGVDVEGVSLEVALSETVEVTSISSTSGSCGLSRAGIRCNDITVLADDSETVTINVEGAEPGYVQANAQVIVPGGDANPSNDTAHSQLVIGDAADLVVRGNLDREGVVGESMDLTLSISNRGPDEAEDAELWIPGDAGFSLGAASTNLGSCTSSDEGISCSFGDFAVATTATVELTVTPARTGNRVLSVTASSALLDINPADNTRHFTVAVPTAPFSLTAGRAGAGDARNNVHPILQLSLAPAEGSDEGVRLTALAGVLEALEDGFSLQERILVYEDPNGDGTYEPGNQYLGAGRFAVEGGRFTLDFETAVTAPVGTSSNLILAVRSGQPAPVLGATPNTVNWSALGWAGALPLAFAGILLARRRERVVMLGLAGALAACGEVADLATAQVSVTITEATGTLLDDHGSPVSAEGLPLEGPKVTLTR